MRDGILMLFTQEVIAKEIGELLQLKLASIFQTPAHAVTCTVEFHRTKVVPHIEVDNDIAEGLTPDQIKNVIGSVWWGIQPVRRGVKEILEERLADLRSRRVKKEAKKEGQETTRAN